MAIPAGVGADITTYPKVTFTVTSPMSGASDIVNTATASPASTQTDTDTTNNSASVTVRYVMGTMTDLQITKSSVAEDGSNVLYTPGEDLTYTITATNSGPLAVTDAVVNDVLPAALSGATVTCDDSGAPGAGTCPGAPAFDGSGNMTLGAMASGDVIVLTVTGTVTASATGDLTNAATISSATISDSNTANNTATVVDARSAKADFRVVKSSTATTVLPGGTVTYTLAVTNDGPSDSTASLTDTLPVQFASGTWTCTNTPDAGNECAAASGSMPLSVVITANAGETVNVTVTGTLVSPLNTSTVSNTAVVVGTAADSDPGDNTSTKVIAVDTDGDGLSNDDELTEGTDPTNPDTDGDGGE
jgi:uncharacterized repeat protein (TIGR01451 family)